MNIAKHWGIGFILIFGIVFHGSLKAQAVDFSERKTVHFIAPVHHKIRISGTFGELRPNHFHAGIDIKSSHGHPGDSVFSMADGYVSRIKIQSGGYGNSLYIRYPGGWTVLYAHLQSFTPEIATYVKAQQYIKKSFELNLYPPKGKFRFHRGALVGIMGNSGHSFGPHLHLEMRRNNGNVPFNPLKYLDFVKDTIAPVFRYVNVEGLTPDYRRIAERKIKVEGRPPHQGLSIDTIIIPAWRAAVSVRLYDQVNGSKNKNGIYRIRMDVEGKTVYDFVANSCSFGETRYVNAHMIYAKQVKYKEYWHRCYLLPGNELDMYSVGGKGDVFDIFAYKPKRVDLFIEDAAGNHNHIRFFIKRRRDIPDPEPKAFHYQLLYDRDNYMSWGNASLYLPKKSLYQNAYVSVGMSEASLPVIQIGDKTIPLHKYGTLALRHLQIDTQHRGKLLLAMKDKKDLLSFGGYWRKGQFRCSINRMGRYFLALDTLAPVITPLNARSSYRRGDVLKFKVKDNFKVAGKAKSLRYKGTMDGQWILIEFDSKKDMLKHILDEHTAIGTHVFRLTVTDDRGNKRVYEKELRVKEK